MRKSQLTHRLVLVAGLLLQPAPAAACATGALDAVRCQASASSVCCCGDADAMSEDTVDTAPGCRCAEPLPPERAPTPAPATCGQPVDLGAPDAVAARPGVGDGAQHLAVRCTLAAPRTPPVRIALGVRLI